MSAPFSIIDELLGGQRSTTAPGATSLIRRLLEAAANEAIEAKSDVLTGYSLVKTASERSDAIDKSILRIDENGSDDAAWTIFDQYVKDIQKLELFLLDLGSISGKSGVALELDDVSVCQGSIKIWETNRNRLHTQLQKLRGEDIATQAWEQRRDDAAMFRMMVSQLELIVPATDPDLPMLKALESLQSLLARVDDAVPPHSDSVFHGIKAAWLMRGAIAEMNNAGTTPDRKYHLGHDDVWNLGKSFAEKIALEETAALAVAYEKFLEKLTGNSTPPTQNYIKLILASNNVTRPFLMRNRILVEYCRELVKQYNSHSTTRAANLGNVTLAISKSLEATKAAAVVEPDEVLDSTADLSTPKSAFDEAMKKLTFSLEQYSEAKATELDTRMKEAITEDEARLLRLQGRFKNTTSMSDDVSEEVSVTIKGGSGSSPVKVRGNTKIRALLWSEQTKVPGSTFVGARIEATGKLVDLDEEISALAPTDGNPLVLELTQAAKQVDKDAEPKAPAALEEVD